MAFRLKRSNITNSNYLNYDLTPFSPVVFKSVIEQVILNGGESWPARGQDTSIGTVEMKYYRRIMGKTRRDRIRNERIREELKQKSVYEILQKRQLKSIWTCGKNG